MPARLRRLAFVTLAVGLGGCFAEFPQPAPFAPDGTADGAADVPQSVRPDARPDAAFDATSDAAVDAAPDALADAAADAAASADAAPDAGPEPCAPGAADCTVCAGDELQPPCNGCPPGVIVPAGWSCIPPGIEARGSPPDEPERVSPDEDLHPVCVSRPLLVQQTELTRGQWAALVGSAPADHAGCDADDCPVTDVSWHDAIAWLDARSRGDGFAPCHTTEPAALGVFSDGCPDADDCPGPAFDRVRLDPRCAGYRLPTDAEWERMTRAGRETPWTSGANAAALDGWAWHAGNAEGRAHPVGGQQANSYGLLDVHGNVAERVFDCFGRPPDVAVSDPFGLLSCVEGLGAVRGGSFEDPPASLRSAARYAAPYSRRSRALGLRPVRALQRPEWRFPCPPSPGQPADGVEICDGLDDDGDGAIDEGLPLGAPCARPGNGRGVYACDAAGGLRCGAPPDDHPLPEPARDEICDGIDDDWDGRVDEGLADCHRCDGIDDEPPCNGCPAGIALWRPVDAGATAGAAMVCIPAATASDEDRPVELGPIAASEDEALLARAEALGLARTPACGPPEAHDRAPYSPDWLGALGLANAASIERGLPPCYRIGPLCPDGAVCFDGLACPGLRLPTEDEWAHLVDIPVPPGASYGDPDACAGDTCDGAEGLHPARGTDGPFGLRAIFGSAHEWLHDRWEWRAGEPAWVLDRPDGCPDDAEQPCRPTTWRVLDALPAGAPMGRRGGSHRSADPQQCFSFSRSTAPFDDGGHETGVRLVQTLRRPDRAEPCNGLDDDGDLLVDEVHLGGPCTVGRGACARDGVRACADDGVRCLGEPGEPAEETCDGTDEDCDGAVDEAPACDPAAP